MLAKRDSAGPEAEGNSQGSMAILGKEGPVWNDCEYGVLRHGDLARRPLPVRTLDNFYGFTVHLQPDKQAMTNNVVVACPKPDGGLAISFPRIPDERELFGPSVEVGQSVDCFSAV